MQYYAMGEGEKIVVRAFLEKLMEERQKEQKELDRLRKGRRNK